jgi:hypothetical protein
MSQISLTMLRSEDLFCVKSVRRQIYQSIFDCLRPRGNRMVNQSRLVDLGAG